MSFQDEIMDLLFNQEKIWELDMRDAWNEGFEKGLEEGEMLAAIHALMKFVGMTAEDAMSTLKIPELDQPIYLELLKHFKQ